MKLQQGQTVSAKDLRWCHTVLVDATNAVRLLQDKYGCDDLMDVLEFGNSSSLVDNLKALSDELNDMVDIAIKPSSTVGSYAVEYGDCRSFLDEHGHVFKTEKQLSVVKEALELLVPALSVDYNASDDWMLGMNEDA